MPKFIKGLRLNELFWEEKIKPLMAERFPRLVFSAGLAGHGSDVLGYDTPVSTDHNWGPHLHLFFAEKEFADARKKVDNMLRRHLPYTFRGWPTHFRKGDRYLRDKPVRKKSGPVNHLFEFWTAKSFFGHYLGFNIDKQISFRDWLLFPQQALIETTAGKIYHDGLRIIDQRRRFVYYPDDVWKYMMRVQWGKIIDELSIPARTAETGDKLGSLIVTGRTIHNVMFLVFLLERRYAPYGKWFGTAFCRMKNGRKLNPLLLRILLNEDWRDRQKTLARVYQHLGRMHNKLGITRPLTTKLIDFYGRQYKIIDIWEYVGAIEKSIKNERLRNMKYPLGNVDQFIDHARINNLDYFYWNLKDVIR